MKYAGGVWTGVATLVVMHRKTLFYVFWFAASALLFYVVCETASSHHPSPKEIEIARLQRELKELAKKLGKKSPLWDGVHDARIDRIYTVQGDCVWSRRLEDRERVADEEVADNGGIAPLHHDERVRVIEIRRHVRFGEYVSNWSRVQSLDTPDKTPVWVFSEVLHAAK